MDIFVQQLINGITLGSNYGLIAIGYTLVFGIIGMVNFAHGDVFMVSAFIGLVTLLIVTAWLGIGSLAAAPPGGVGGAAGGAPWCCPRASTGGSRASPTGRCAARSAAPR